MRILEFRSGSRTSAAVTAIACCALLAGRVDAATLFQVTNFANPAWSVTYFTGFSGTVGVTSTWPAEMGWEGDTIDIAFALPAGVPPEAREYRFRIVVTQHFAQSFVLTLQAGPSLSDLVEVQREFVDTARVFAATIPLARFTPGQTNYIRIQGLGVQVGNGQPSGIQWTKWTLTRTDTPLDPDATRWNQLQRMAWYLQSAIQANGMVRDSLTLSPSDPPYHPATPDAAGFALIGLCVADQFGLMTDAAARAEDVLSAYAGHTPGVTPTRNVKGHWWHWMNVNTGAPEPGWNDQYTTIGSGLLVGGALFAKNHFDGNASIAVLADELYATTDFDAMIDPGLSGAIYAATDINGNALGYVGPWNEYMILVTLALRQPVHPRATAVAPFWLTPANLPKRSYRGISTLTDNVNAYAPAFWVHDGHFLNTDFATSGTFEDYLRSHQRADAIYCAADLGQLYRYGLTAGVDPTGYFADHIQGHHNVFSPEAVAAGSDFHTVLEYVADQPTSNPGKLRYGLTRVYSPDLTWIPDNAALVDHMYLMFGLAEGLDPVFFKQRLPFQVDNDGNGLADVYQCGTPWADADGDGDVDLADLALMQPCATGGTVDDGCLCFDRNNNGQIDLNDLVSFANCLDASGPEVPANPNCGN